MSSAAEKASACHSPEAEDAPRQAGREAATERQAVQCPMPDLVPQSESPGTSLARFQVFTTPLVQHHVPPFRDEPAENLLAVFLPQQVQLEVVQETLGVGQTGQPTQQPGEGHVLLGAGAELIGKLAGKGQQLFGVTGAARPDREDHIMGDTEDVLNEIHNRTDALAEPPAETRTRLKQDRTKACAFPGAGRTYASGSIRQNTFIHPVA